MVNSQVIRLHNLAAFQWFHEDVISRIPGQETSGYLTAYFQQIADARDVHNDMIQKPMGRRQSVEILKVNYCLWLSSVYAFGAFSFMMASLVREFGGRYALSAPPCGSNILWLHTMLFMIACCQLAVFDNKKLVV